MYVGLVLLFLLAASIAVGIVRKLRGGQFFPEPAPREDRHIVDKTGRWWRQSEDGVFEETFRRPAGAPSVAKSILVNTARYYVQLLLWFGVPAVIIVGLLWLSTAVAEVGIPEWLSWVGAVVAYLLLLRIGRKRGWF